MEKQLIISVGREYGSGGHRIAEELAKRFGLTSESPRNKPKN